MKAEIDLSAICPPLAARMSLAYLAAAREGRMVFRPNADGAPACVPWCYETAEEAQACVAREGAEIVSSVSFRGA